MCPVVNAWRGVINTYRDDLCDDYVRRNGFFVRISRPPKHESKKKKRDRADNTPLAVVLGHAVQMIRF